MVRVSGACKASFNVCIQEEGTTGKLRRQVIDHLRKSVVGSAGFQLQQAARFCHNLGTLSADLANLDAIKLICCGQILKVQSGIYSKTYSAAPCSWGDDPLPSFFSNAG